MKKSNIILISILGISVVITIVTQIHLKNTLDKIEDTTMVLSYDHFSALHVGTGWYVNLVQDNETKISISADSIKSFISLNENTLSLKDIEDTDRGRIKIDISNRIINKIKIKGRSYLKYNVDFIDTLNIIQTDESKLIIKGTKEDDDPEAEEKVGVINYASIKLSNTADIRIYHNVKNLTGELRDSSFFRSSEQVIFTKFEKSEEADIRSW